MIKLTNISKYYDYSSGRTYALRNVSLTIDQGESVAIVGKSGAGKTTLLNIIGGLDTFQEGSYFWKDQDLSKLSDSRLAKFRNESVGFVIQDFALVPHKTALFNVMLPMYFDKTPHKLMKPMALESLDQMEISHLANKKVSVLSGGEKQRIAIARAILKNAPILLLDESTASLDADNEERINRALDHLMKGKTVFVIAHRLNTIQNADQIILLNNGNIEEIGTHLELLKKRGHYYTMIQEQEKAKAWIAKGE